MLYAPSRNQRPILLSMRTPFRGWEDRLPHPHRARHRHEGRVYVGPAGVRSYDPEWRQKDPAYAALRDAHLEKHPRCEVGIGCQGRREVHHVGPRHLYPELRYHPGNLMTLCEVHHLALHGGEWGRWVPSARALASQAARARWTLEELQARAARVAIWHRLPWRVQAPPILPPVGSPPSIFERAADFARLLYHRAVG